MGKLKSVYHDFTYKQWINKVSLTKGYCPKCKKFIGINKLTLDHIFPLSKAPIGLLYTINDVRPICKPCNSRKGN